MKESSPLPLRHHNQPTPSLRRVRLGDLTTLKQMHDQCFPIVYPEEFYRKLLTPLWVAIVAVVPATEEQETQDSHNRPEFGSLGLGLVGNKIGSTPHITSSSTSTHTQDPVRSSSSSPDRIVGFITGTGKVLHTSIIPVPVGYISTIGVDPSFRCGGVGELMLNAFMRTMRYHYNFNELRVFYPEDSTREAVIQKETYDSQSSHPRIEADQSPNDRMAIEPLHPQSQTTPTWAERVMETILHTSPLSLLATWFVRTVARLELLHWYVRGRREGRGPPPHDRRIFQDPTSDVTQVWLHVLATNTVAINFYKKRNFKVVKFLGKFYQFNNAEHDGIIMCYDLAAERQLGRVVPWDNISPATGGNAILNGARPQMSDDEHGYYCSIFAHSSVSKLYSSSASSQQIPSTTPNIAGATSHQSSEGMARRTVSPRHPLTAQTNASGQSTAIPEEQVLVSNAKSSVANRLFQFFTTGSLSATFDSLDNIEEAEQSNSVQWLLCTLVVVTTALMGVGTYTLMTIASSPPRARRSLHSK